MSELHALQAQGQELLASSSSMPALELGNGEADREDQEEEEQELKSLAVRKTVIERVPSLAQWMSRLTGTSNENPIPAKPAEPLKGAIHRGGLGGLQQVTQRRRQAASSSSQTLHYGCTPHLGGDYIG